MLTNTRILDNAVLQSVAPSIFATEPFHAMSDKYRFLPTIDAVNAMRDNGFQPVKAMQSKSRIPGKGDFTKHMIRFRHNDFLSPQNVGEEIPEIVLVNSHDGTSAYKLMAGIFRLVCSNGMIIQSADMGSISVRHSGNDNMLGEVIDASFEIIEEAPKQFAQIDTFKRIALAPSQQEIFAKAALELKGAAAAETFDAEKFLQSRRFADGSARETRDLWRTMNVVQENMIKGGIRGRSASNRRTSTRAVKSVSEDVRINKALWILTENMAKLAA